MNSKLFIFFFFHTAGDAAVLIEKKFDFLIKNTTVDLSRRFAVLIMNEKKDKIYKN